jgi:DNA polymerase elongation subunit (family B)
MRQAALKWILVTCFGYLGYRNARFGKVDAHIAVCAFARDVLLKTARMAEEHGFEVIHGIVDSLWLKKDGVSPREVVEFCREASKAFDVPLGVEGKYRWIVFLPSKVLKGVPVLNRYYGVFDDGKIKMRGIEARRGDTPEFVRKAQADMIRTLAGTSNLESFKAKIPEALEVLKEYADKLIREEVNIHELLITKRLSKSPPEYAHDVFQAIAAKQLEKAGFDIQAGQTVQYLVVNSKSKKANNRVVAAQFLEASTGYDVEEYLKMLLSAAETLFEVFGYTSDKIRAQTLQAERQETLTTML